MTIRFSRNIIEMERAIQSYVELVQSKVDTYWTAHNFTFAPPPTITAQTNKKYVRIISNCNYGNSKSVHTFIDRTNGDILKAGTWKAPQANGIRGNIFADNVANVVNEHGAIYLR